MAPSGARLYALTIAVNIPKARLPHPDLCAFSRALAALAAFSVGPASAAEVVLEQPAACAIADELTFRAERALGQTLATAAAVRCTVYIERAPLGFKARLEVASPELPERSRQRLFTAPTCETLTDALAVAVVLAIGSRLDEAAAPDAAAQRSPEGVVDHVAAPVPAEVEPPSDTSGDLATPPATLAQTNPRVRWGARAALVFDAGTLPAPAWGAMLGAAVGGDAFEARLVGTYLWPRQVSVNTFMPGSGAELAVAAAGLLGCAPRLLTWERLELGACIGAELGWIWGRGTGLSVNADRGSTWVAGRADAGARWGLGPEWLGVDLALASVVPLQRSAFVISNEGEAVSAHRPEVVEIRVSLGLSAEFD